MGEPFTIFAMTSTTMTTMQLLVHLLVTLVSIIPSLARQIPLLPQPQLAKHAQTCMILYPNTPAPLPYKYRVSSYVPNCVTFNLPPEARGTCNLVVYFPPESSNISTSSMTDVEVEWSHKVFRNWMEGNSTIFRGRENGGGVRGGERMQVINHYLCERDMTFRMRIDNTKGGTVEFLQNWETGVFLTYNCRD